MLQIPLVRVVVRNNGLSLRNTGIMLSERRRYHAQEGNTSLPRMPKPCGQCIVEKHALLLGGILPPHIGERRADVAATVPLCGLRLRSCALNGNPLCCAAPFYRTDKSKQEPRRPGFDKPGLCRSVCRRPCKPARRHTVPAIPADGVAWRVSLVCVRSIMAITSKEDMP